MFSTLPPRGYWLLAHRGARYAAAGNTTAAFDAALHLGADGIEVDLRWTRDGRWVVHHDATIAHGRRRTHLEKAGMPAAVEGRSLEGLVRWAGAHPQAIVNLELKDVGDDGDLGNALHQLHGRVLVTSFLPEALERVRKAHPRVPCGLLARHASALNVRIARLLDARCVVWRDRYADPAVLRAASDDGVASFVWDVRSRRRADALRAAGASGVITDHLPRLVGASGGPTARGFQQPVARDAPVPEA